MLLLRLPDYATLTSPAHYCGVMESIAKKEEVGCLRHDYGEVRVWLADSVVPVS